MFGAVSAVAFVPTVLFAGFMVGGDGTAPAFSHVMLAMAMAPKSVFGIPSEISFVVSQVFWGLVVAVSTYLLVHLMRTIYQFFQAAL